MCRATDPNLLSFPLTTFFNHSTFFSQNIGIYIYICIGIQRGEVIIVVDIYITQLILFRSLTHNHLHKTNLSNFQCKKNKNKIKNCVYVKWDCTVWVSTEFTEWVETQIQGIILQHNERGQKSENNSELDSG